MVGGKHGAGIISNEVYKLDMRVNDWILMDKTMVKARSGNAAYVAKYETLCG